MNCPKCHQYVDDNLSFCTHCGEPVQSGLKIDDDLVFSEKEAPPVDRGHGSKIVLIVIAVLIVCVGAVAFFLIIRQNNQQTSAPAQTVTSQGTTAVTEGTTETDSAKLNQNEVPTIAPPETIVPETKAPQTTAAPAFEDALETYARSSGMMEILKQAADAHTTLSVKGEENALRARYRVNLDSSADENSEYFEMLPDTYDNLCAQLDKNVYDMNRQDGIRNAVVEIYVFDSSGKQVYGNTVD